MRSRNYASNYFNFGYDFIIGNATLRGVLAIGDVRGKVLWVTNLLGRCSRAIHVLRRITLSCTSATRSGTRRSGNSCRSSPLTLDCSRKPT
jgi:hypothetical protein